MNERIFELARQSGATDENGSRATTLFCFTDQELKGFAELIVRECADIAWNNDDFLTEKIIKQHFGVQ